MLPPSQRNKDRWFNTAGFERISTRVATSYHRRLFPPRVNRLPTQRLTQPAANLQETSGITGPFRAQFRVDLLNAPNYQALAGPVTDPASASFRRTTGYVNTPRYNQFQSRLSF